VDDPGVVDNLVKEGKVHPLTVDLINLERICSNYGWTPEEADSIDPFIMEAFMHILNGRAEYHRNNKPKK